MMEHQLYIFNFDNTLFDTEEGLEICYQQAFGTIGVEYEKEMLKEFMREPLMETYRRYSSDMSLFKTFEDTFYSTSDVVIRDHATVFDDTAEVIKYLKNAGKDISIITTNSSDAVSDVLKKYRMSEYFDNVIGHGDYSNDLPDPEALELCISKYPELSKNDAVYIGDSKFDMLAADNAGIFSVFVDRPSMASSENGSPDRYDLRIKTLYGLLTGCRICSTSTFAVHYDLLDEDVDLDKIIKDLSSELGVDMDIVSKDSNHARIKVGENSQLNIFPHGIIVKNCISKDTYHIDSTNILKTRDELVADPTKKFTNDLMINTINNMVQEAHPKKKKDRIASHSNSSRDSKNVTSYHMTSLLGDTVKGHFNEDILYLLNRKEQTLSNDLYTELENRGIPYGMVNDSDMLAAMSDSRVLLTVDDDESTLNEYLDLEARIQNSWFLTYLMNSLVDSLATKDLDDVELIRETLDTMYTNATFKYVVTSSNQRHMYEMADVLYRASNLESISNDFKTKAELLNQMIELSTHISDTQSSNMLNNILLALTLVSSASAVFQILGYWAVNTAEYNYYSLFGSIIIICAVLAVFLVTNRSQKKKRRELKRPR